MTANPYIDIHTHKVSGALDTIEVLNITPDDKCTGMASCGLHPWNVDCDWERAIEAVRNRAYETNIVLIGEAGIDKICGTDIALQIMAMEKQAIIAEEVEKPMIIHCVKGFDEIISIRKAVKARHRWIIHGFRGKPQSALQLTRNGFDISLGKMFNPETAKAIPLKCLWAETDETDSDIRTVYRNIAEARGISVEELKDSIYERFCEINTHKA